MKKYIIMMMVAVCSLLGTNTIFAETLTLSSESGAPGETVTLLVTLGDNNDGVAGASFTLDYDIENLSLNEIRSDFFLTFSAQGITDPDHVVIDTGSGNETYYSALVVNDSGTMLAAANVENGPTGDQTIFELDFQIADTTTAGQTFDVEIIQSTITNADAGYETPTPIPFLVGISADGTSYPTRDVPTPPTAGTVTVSDGIVDTDGDGIDDQWELIHFENLTIATAVSDFDGDGYSDRQEYLNGSEYDPKIMNSPGGPGYVSYLSDSLIYNFAEYGLYTFNQVHGYSKINPSNPAMSIAADIDDDGVEEVVAYFIGYGIYTLDSGIWNRITTAIPQSIVKFNQAIAVNLGSSGLYTYDSLTGWSRLNRNAPSNMVQADIDSDGIMELVASFSENGIYYYDNGTWTRLTNRLPEQVIAFGKGIAVDFGTSVGLYTYNTTQGWSMINNNDVSAFIESDIDSDGVMELVACFPSYGIYYYDDGAWNTRLTNRLPEQMVVFGKGIAVDFGTSAGLYTYNTSQGWLHLNNNDPSQLEIADIDNDNSFELSVVFDGYGLYVWDNDTSQWSMINKRVPSFTRSGNLN